ncbi:MAG TPA: hypothetical protein VFC79_08020, partial [Tissierellaceae bacterium]|nr:hypothetical protein [Tissierellaceae bacterium]
MANFIYNKYNVKVWWDNSTSPAIYDTVTNAMKWQIDGNYQHPSVQVWKYWQNVSENPPTTNDIGVFYYNPKNEGPSYPMWTNGTYSPLGYNLQQLVHPGINPIEEGRYGWTLDPNNRQQYVYGMVQGQTTVDGVVQLLVNVTERIYTTGGHTIYKHAQRTTLTGTLEGTDNQYPSNGLHTDGYWYIRTSELSETAQIIEPAGAETVDGNFEIKWTKTATDVNVDIALSFDNGATWETIATDITGTSLMYDFSSEQETSLARLRTRTRKGSALGSWGGINDGVFTIKHDFAPMTPTKLQPKSKIISKADINRLSWKHNHSNPQSKFIIRWGASQANLSTTIERQTTNQYYDTAADYFPEGNIYWQVQTFSDMGMESPWSDVAVFTAAVPSDNPIITSSSNIVIARPTFSWSQVDQASYQVQLLNSINQVVWDTGEVVSTNKAITSGIDLLNNSTYTLKVRTKTGLGLWTYYTVQTLNVAYTPPAIPLVELIEGDYNITLLIEDPEPTGTQPVVDYHDIYRNGIRIATNVENEYIDNNIGGNIEYSYQVVAVGENETISQTLFHSGSIVITSSVLSDMEGNHVILRTEPAREESRTYLSESLYFAGRRLPVTQFEEFESNNLNLSFVLYNEGELEAFKDIVAKKTTLLYRDNRKRKMFCTISEINIT